MLLVANSAIAKSRPKNLKNDIGHMRTHLKVLSEDYPMYTNMAGFRCFFKKEFVLVLWTKVTSALEGLKTTSRF